MKILPVVFRWDAGGMCMRADPRYALVCRRQYGDGEEYPLAVLEARSRKSHDGYFAQVDKGWHSLPEGIAPRFPTPEHFRKWCLIETEWFEENEVDCGTPKNAKEAAMLARKLDEYARIHIHGQIVIVRRAKSQSAKAMGKDAFESSKNDVLDLIVSMIGTTRADLRKAGMKDAA